MLGIYIKYIFLKSLLLRSIYLYNVPGIGRPIHGSWCSDEYRVILKYRVTSMLPTRGVSKILELNQV